MGGQIQISAVKDMNVITGRKGKRAGKNGLFATLAALLAKQHGRQAAKISNVAPDTIKAAGPAQHQKIRSIADHKAVALATLPDQHGKLSADNGGKIPIKQSKKKNDPLGTIVTPMAAITKIPLRVRVTVHRQERAGQNPHPGNLRQERIKTATAHQKADSVEHLDVSAQKPTIRLDDSGQKNVIFPKTVSGNLLLSGKPAAEKEALAQSSDVKTPENSAMWKNPQIEKGNLSQNGRNSMNALNHPGSAQTVQPGVSSETVANQMPPEGAASAPPANDSAKVQTKKGMGRTLSGMKPVSIPKVSETTSEYNAGSSRTVETGLHIATKKKSGTLSSQTTATAYMHRTDGRSTFAAHHSGAHPGPVQRMNMKQMDVLSRNQACGPVAGDSQPGNTADPQRNQQGHQSGSENRFGGLLQTTQTPRNEPQKASPLRSFQPLHIMEAMDKIAHSAKNGRTRLDIQLEPAHLGKIHVSLQTDAAKQLMVHITAEQPVSQQVIQQNIPQLRHALEQQGLNMGQFSMNFGSRDRSGSDQQFNGRHTWSAMDGPSSGTSPAPVQASTQTSSPGHGRLSIHV